MHRFVSTHKTRPLVRGSDLRGLAQFVDSRLETPDLFARLSPVRWSSGVTSPLSFNLAMISSGRMISYISTEL
jgi:hypothetical protein